MKKHKKSETSVKQIRRVNAVMHAHAYKNIGMAALPFAASSRDLLVGSLTSTAPQARAMSHMANTTQGSSFDQFSINANSRKPGKRVDGAILQFSTDNFIRAGGDDGQKPLRAGGTHASAFLSVLRYSNLANKVNNTPLTWIGAAGAPNIVLSGNFKHSVSPSLGKHHRVTHTAKFPGYAVHTGSDGIYKATPEIFLGGKFIMPGIKTPQHAQETLIELEAIVTPFLITEEPQS